MLNSLNFVVAHVPSVAEVLPFYTEKLELEIEDQQPGFVQFKQSGQGAVYAIFEHGHVEPRSTVELWWSVDDADAALEQFKSQDIPIVEPLADQPFGRTFVITDPAGNKIYV
jgi:predicted enzyme related to lactoylglutathione lyase